jgi:MYXO-CTERM domain-containing protein
MTLVQKVLLSALILGGDLVHEVKIARADGWIHCSGPDSSCNASGANGASVGGALLMIAGVAYGLTRRKRR